MKEIRGVLTAMATPFDANGAVDEAAALKLATYLLEHGSHGLVISGSTGEAPTLTDEEALVLLRAVRREVGDEVLLVCGTGTNYTQHSIELTSGAAEAGADAALIVTPYYNKPNPAGIQAHFEAIAEAVPGPAADRLQHPLAGGRQRAAGGAGRAGQDRQRSSRSSRPTTMSCSRSRASTSSPATTTSSSGRSRSAERGGSASPLTWSARRCAKFGTRRRRETWSGRARSTPACARSTPRWA